MSKRDVTQTAKSARARDAMPRAKNAQPTPSAAHSLQHAQADPRHTSAAEIRTLQKHVGNRAVNRLLQPKLRVGPAGDRFEQDADRAADQVMRTAGQPSPPPEFTVQTAQRAAAPHTASQQASAGGFDAPSGIEQQLASTGKGQPLPDTARAFMEPRLGADLSAVRVHTGPAAQHINRSLESRALTHRGDIYFADGEYRPESPSGQRLLAHELAHTIQQGASPGLQRAPQPGPGAPVSQLAAGSLAAGAIQLKRAVVSSATSTRILTGGLTNNPKVDLKAIAGSPKGQQVKKFDTVELHDDDMMHVSDAKGRPAWYRVTSGAQGREFIRSASVLAGLSSAGDFKTKGTSAPDGTDYAGSVLKGLGDLANTSDDPTLERVRMEDLKVVEYDNAVAAGQTPTGAKPEGSSTGLVRAEGGLWLAGGIFGMAVSIKDLASDDKTAWEKVNAAITFMGSTAGAIGAITQIISSHATEGSTLKENATGMSAFSMGYQEMFTGLAAGVKTIKGVVDLVRMIGDQKQHGRDEWVKVSGDLLISGLETAKGVLRSIRAINEAISGSVSAQFAQALPGIDIAIAAVKSIVQGYYLVVSAVEWHRMSNREDQEMMGLIGGKNYAKQDIKQARKAYRHEDAQMSQLDMMINQKDVKITSSTKKRDAIKDDASAKDLKKRDALTTKIAALNEKKGRYEANRTSRGIDHSIDRDRRAMEAGHEGPSRDEVEEVALANALKTTNKRRVVRQAIHIGANLVQIAASIASMVSGPGAPAAIALKAAAAGIDMSLPFFRWIKQAGRNTAARNEAKGKTGISNKIFNADKSSVAKLNARKKQAVLMLKMVARLNNLANDPVALKAQGKKVESYLSASGVDTDALYRLNGKPDAQITLLVKALAERELGGE